jgi:hypothetical protein
VLEIITKLFIFHVKVSSASYYSGLSTSVPRKANNTLVFQSGPEMLQYLTMQAAESYQRACDYLTFPHEECLFVRLILSPNKMSLL